MVIKCPHCDGNVGEESCTGCRRVIPHYICSSCKKLVPNPRYQTGLVCKSCGTQVHIDPQKQVRHLVKAYLCQGCGEIVSNPAFQYEHSCAGCQPPACPECGGFMAYNTIITWKKCILCGHVIVVEDSETNEVYAQPPEN